MEFTLTPITRGGYPYVLISIERPLIGAPIEFEKQVLPSSTAAKTGLAFIEKSGAYWANQTLAEYERSVAYAAEVRADVARWGSE